MKRVAVAAAAAVAIAAPRAADAASATRLRHSGARSGAGALLHAGAGTMEVLYPYYHTSDNITAELDRLAASCPGMSVKKVGGDVSIDVVTIRAPGSAPVNKNFFLFGEHARELISPESGLHFVRSLCGETDLSEQAKHVLEDSEFQIVVNGNPGSRREVEKGDFCLRVNPDGVDLNRNWDEEFEPPGELSSEDTFPGMKPFSEKETRAFKQLVEDYRPTTFLTIHSGTKGMYMPWAYDMQHLAERNRAEMIQILRGLDEKHCECPYGAAGREVGYSCPGTSLDYVYDKLNTPYAFAFEIYTSPDEWEDLQERWQEKISSKDPEEFLQLGSNLASEHFKDLFVDHPSSFVQVRHTKHHRRGRSRDDDCFPSFNPDSEDEYRKVIENWSSAYLEMSAMVAKNLKANATAQASL